MQKSLLFLLLFTSTIFADYTCDAYTFQAGTQEDKLNGYLRFAKGSETLDIKKDLDISQAKVGLKAMLSRSTSHHKFSFKIEKYKHSGSKELSLNVLRNSSQQATSSLINSQISLKWAKASYRYRFSKDFALGLDLNGMRLKTMVSDDEHKRTLLLPSLGADYEKELEEGLKVITKASSTLTEDTNRYLYAYAGLSFDIKLLRCSALHLGYQYKKLHIDSKDIDLLLKYQGLYAGISMKF